MQNVVDKKDDIVMKLIHYFVTHEDYKPVLVNGLQNEVWLENMENDIKLIRININYIHNNEQLNNDLRKADLIRRSVKRKTYSRKMNLLNILLDTGENVYLEEDKEGITTIKCNKITEIKKDKKVESLFPDLSKEIVTKKSNSVDLFNMTEELNNKNEMQEKKVANLFKKRIPCMTYIIMFINILIFCLMINPKIYSLFINAGANYYENVQNGEVYRLVTSMFLHGNLFHLLCNMYALYILGPEIENYYGKGKFLFIYFISGIVGSLFSCTFSNYASVGASGAIFGLIGALGYFGYVYRATLDGFLKKQIFPLLFINLVIGIAIPGIDVLAHLGGLIGGIFVSVLVALRGQDKSSKQIHAGIMLSIIILALSYMLYIK